MDVIFVALIVLCALFFSWIVHLRSQVEMYRKRAASGKAITDLRNVADKVYEIVWRDAVANVYLLRTEDFAYHPSSLCLVCLDGVASVKNGPDGKFVIFTEQQGGKMSAAFLEDPDLANKYIESKKKYKDAARASVPYVHTGVKVLQEQYDIHFDTLFR